MEFCSGISLARSSAWCRGPAVFAGLRAEEAIWAIMFGYLGIRDGSWTIVHRSWPWSREAWPFPCFKNRDPITGRYWRRRIDESNLATMLHQEHISAEEADSLPQDGLAGAVFVEKRLSRLLGAST